MTPSQTCIDMDKGYEQCRLVGYLPTHHDVPTIGWGCTGRDIHVGMVWSQETADARFASEIKRVGTAVTGILGSAPTTQNQFDALVSFAYNEGVQRLHDSLLIAYHRQGHFATAASYFMHYTKQAGVVLGGLVKRREAERALYLKA